MARVVNRDTLIRIRSGEGDAARMPAGTRDIFAELREQGLVAVPLKPSMDQIIAATVAAEVSVEQAWQVYTAMLGAVESSRNS